MCDLTVTIQNLLLFFSFFFVRVFCGVQMVLWYCWSGRGRGFHPHLNFFLFGGGTVLLLLDTRLPTRKYVPFLAVLPRRCKRQVCFFLLLLVEGCFCIASLVQNNGSGGGARGFCFIVQLLLQPVDGGYVGMYTAGRLFWFVVASQTRQTHIHVLAP